MLSSQVVKFCYLRFFLYNIIHNKTPFWNLTHFHCLNVNHAAISPYLLAQSNGSFISRFVWFYPGKVCYLSFSFIVQISHHNKVWKIYNKIHLGSKANVWLWKNCNWKKCCEFCWLPLFNWITSVHWQRVTSSMLWMFLKCILSTWIGSIYLNRNLTK